MLRKHDSKLMFLLIGLSFLIISGVWGEVEGEKPVYLDSTKPVEQRVDDLIARMTLEEKVGQMNIPCTYKRRFGWNVKPVLGRNS